MIPVVIPTKAGTSKCRTPEISTPRRQAASGLPVLVHLNGFAMVRLK